MGFKKDKETGGHKNIILIPPDRSNRTRFIKTPLLKARGGFVGFLADLLRGGPNPFLGSPIAVHIDRRTKIEKNAKRVGRAGDKEAADLLIVGIDSALKERWQESLGRADDEFDDLDTYLKEEEGWLENLRPRTIKANLESDLGKRAMKVSGRLGPIATTEAKRRLELDHFMKERGLTRTTHWGKTVTAGAILMVIGITIFEFILNTLFFSGSSQTGVFGGAGLALLLSVVTIVLGVGFGIAFQFFGANAKGGGWFGRILALLLFLALIFYLLLLTLARVAGEAGDIDMFRTAAREIQVHPFSGLLDLPALAYCFFTIGVIALVYVKFIQLMGHYWGLRVRRLALNDAEDEFEDERDELVADGQEEVDEALELLRAAPDHIQLATRAISELVLNYENVVDQLRNDKEALSDASRLLLRVIRIHTGQRENAQELTIDFDSPIAKEEARFAEFRERAAKLEASEEIDLATVERCGEELLKLGQEGLGEIEKRCNAVREERYRALGGTAPPLDSAGENDNVAWLPAVAQ